MSKAFCRAHKGICGLSNSPLLGQTEASNIYLSSMNLCREKE
jgi:hypothetical protein